MKTERKQERFFWVFCMTGLSNAMLSSLLPWYGAVTFLCFSLVRLIGCARWMEVPWVIRHLEGWFERASVTGIKDQVE